jgi:hypothetical protein
LSSTIWEAFQRATKVGDALVAGHAGRQPGGSSRREMDERQRDEALRGDLAIGEAVDGDGVAGIVLALAGGIGERGHAGVDKAAVAAEGQAGEERLLGVEVGASVREVGEHAGFGIEDRERLIVVGLVGSVAGIHGDHIAAAGRDGHGHGQTVQPLGMAGNDPDQLFA